MDKILSLRSIAICLSFILLVSCTNNSESNHFGKLQVSINGLPSGVNANVQVSTQTETLTGTKVLELLVGRYSVSANSISAGNTTYVPTVSVNSIEVVEKTTVTVNVIYNSELGNPAKNPSGITLELNSLFYGDQSEVSVVLDFHSVIPPKVVYGVVLSASESKDVEYVELKSLGGSRYESTKSTLVQVNQGTVKSPDGVLSLLPNERFYAMYYVDKTQPSLAAVEEGIVADFGIMERKTPGTAPVRVENALSTASLDEITVPPGGKAVGTLLRKDDPPVQIASEEVIFYPRDDAQLSAFLQRSKGKQIGVQDFADDIHPGRKAYLIQVDSSTGDVEHLDQLREVFGEKGELLGSKNQVLGIFALVMQYRLEGFAVAVNPRVQFHSPPRIPEAGNVSHTMSMVGAKNATEPCVPGDANRSCVEDVPALWSYLALWDKDQTNVNVAILDGGFAPNSDFRGSNWIECTVSFGGVQVCAPGVAEGIPTVGNSLFGDRSWHGTGVITTLGGIINNDYSAGVGGQVATPMLYKYGLLGYAFEFGAGIRKAVDDGASCINISAGYPCNILTNVGPEWDLCSVSGRAGICATVTLGVATAAAVTCGATGWIPFVGAGICGIALSGAATATAACLSTLAFGDLKGPMQFAVDYAVRNGVPVVASAGNALSPETLPEILRSYVNLSERRLERWGSIPAALPGVIAVGAVEGDLSNAEIFGNRVDIWAPIRSNYYAPTSVDDPGSPVVQESIGGTSAAAPYITGVIAAMQAVNPQLNPRTPGLTVTSKAGIVARIRKILTSTAFSNSDLAALGYANQPSERRNLVNPLAAVEIAGIGIIPDTIGFDQSLNFNELLPDLSNDTVTTAKPIIANTPQTGTVLQIGSLATRDQDWFALQLPSRQQSTLNGVVYATELTNHYLGENLAPILIEPNLESSFLKSTQVGTDVYEVASYASVSGNTPGTQLARDLTFAMTSGSHLQDYVYKINVSPPTQIFPTLTITDPSSIPVGGFCQGDDVSFAVRAFYPNHPNLIVPQERIHWFGINREYGSGNLVHIRLNDLGENIVMVQAFDNLEKQQNIHFNVKSCQVLEPRLEITISPLAPGNEAYYRFSTISLQANLFNSNLVFYYGWTITSYKDPSTVLEGPVNIKYGSFNPLIAANSIDFIPHAIPGKSGDITDPVPNCLTTGGLFKITVTGYDKVGNPVVSTSKFIKIYCEPG